MNPEPLRHWLAQPKPSTHRFPYDRVVDAYQHYGKHFVPEAWMALLGAARSRLPEVSGPREHLAAFLDAVLDKVDGRFDYRTYLALRLLPIPGPDSDSEPADRLLARRDRLHVLLLADLVAFELRALEGTGTPMSELRPASLVVRKRLHHAVRAAGPALRRLSFDVHAVDDPVALARRLVAMACIGRTSADRLALRTSMLPVSGVHDEWLFIRTLQSFELTFGLLAVDLTAVVAAVREGRLPSAGIRLSLAATLLRESAPLWSLLATMQPEAFHRFRVHTDGASAIQSRAYKLVESLCRTPDPQRLHSAAYRSVPEVRARIHSEQISLDDALDRIPADHRTLAEVPALADGMDQFAAAVHQWRRTHYRLAARMLGTDQPGTGATPGTPYLLQGRDSAVFASRDPITGGDERS